jgi:hypothetical protein
MANEITYSMSLSCVKGNSSEKQAPGTLNADQTTQGVAGDVQIIGTSEEVVAYGDLVAPRWAFFRNLDTTNYIDIGPTSGGAMVACIRLKAGECAQFPIGASVVLRAQANTASCKLKKLILET